MSDEATVLLWTGREHYVGDYFTDQYDSADEYPVHDERLTIEDGTALVYEDDPHHRGYYGIHCEEPLFGDTAVTVNVYASDSVNSRGLKEGDTMQYVDEDYWTGPFERGFTFRPDQEGEPYWAEFGGRILIHVEVEDE